MTQNCIFCKIAEGDALGYKVYEDDKVIAFLDYRPVRPGATMVVPKKHYEHFIDLPDALAAHITKVGNDIGKAMAQKLQPKPLRIGFAVSGFGVPHVHYHVIPMYDANDITSGVYARNENGEVIFDLANTPKANPEDLQAMAKLLEVN